MAITGNFMRVRVTVDAEGNPRIQVFQHVDGVLRQTADSRKLAAAAGKDGAELVQAVLAAVVV